MMQDYFGNFMIFLERSSLEEHLEKENMVFRAVIITNSFNEYFVNVGPRLAGEIPQSQRSFKVYLKGFDSSFEELTLPDEQIKQHFSP